MASFWLGFQTDLSVQYLDIIQKLDHYPNWFVLTIRILHFGSPLYLEVFFWVLLPTPNLTKNYWLKMGLHLEKLEIVGSCWTRTYIFLICKCTQHKPTLWARFRSQCSDPLGRNREEEVDQTWRHVVWHRCYPWKNGKNSTHDIW